MRRYTIAGLAVITVLAICSVFASASTYLGLKTGAGAGMIGAEVEFEITDSQSIVLEGGTTVSGGVSAVGGALGFRGYLSQGPFKPFVTGYLGTITASYFDWYSGPVSANVTYYGGTVGAKYLIGKWYISGEIGYGYVPTVATGGMMLGASVGVKF